MQPQVRHMMVSLRLIGPSIVAPPGLQTRD